jgi:serine protease Do
MSLVRRDENLVPSLGILAMDIDEKVTPLLPPLRRLSGALIAGALEDGAGAAAGLAAGDVIYEMNNRSIGSLKDLLEAASDLKSGQSVVLHIERAGQLQFVQLDAY